MNARSSRIAIAFSSLALVAATAACSSGAPDEENAGKATGEVTAQKQEEGATTETATVTPQSTTDCQEPDPSTLEPSEEESAAPDEHFVATGQSCGPGRSLRPYQANACRVGVTSAGTG